MVKRPNLPVPQKHSGLSLVVLGFAVLDAVKNMSLQRWLRTSIVNAQTYLSEQGGDDFYEDSIDLSVATQHDLDFTSWIEAIEENVTLLCDLAPTIQSMISEACEPPIPDGVDVLPGKDKLNTMNADSKSPCKYSLRYADTCHSVHLTCS